jgi:DNA-binding NarL/FixJ family response regulator
VLFHREALASALCTFEDVALIGSVSEVHAALSLVEETNPDALVVDSPSDAVAHELAAQELECKVVFVGAVGKRCRHMKSLGASIFIGGAASLDEVHVALRAAKPRPRVQTLPESFAQSLGASADPILTLREQQVSRLIAGGYSNKEIAGVCGISLATVKNHVHRILGKLNVQRRAQIARLAG